MIKASWAEMSVRQVESHMWERIKAGYTRASIWRWRVG